MADLKIQTLIEILTKGKGGEDAVKVLRQLETESRKTRKGFGDTGKSSSGLSKDLGVLAQSAATVKTALAGIGIGLGLSQVTAFVTGAVTGFAKTERSMNALRFQIRALGGDYEGTAASAQTFIDSLSEQSGILDDELIPALSKALLVFDDMGAAQETVALAAKFAANGFGTVETNVEKLTGAFQKNSSKGLAEFGIATKDATGKAIDLSEAMRRLHDQAATLPDALDDAQARLNHAAILWDNFSDSVGKALDEIAERAINSKTKVLDFINQTLGGIGGRLATQIRKLEQDAEAERVKQETAAAEDDVAFGPGAPKPEPESPLARKARENAEKAAKAAADEEAAEHAKQLAKKLEREAEFEKRRIQNAKEFTEEQHLEDLDAEAEFFSRMDELSREAEEQAEELRAEQREEASEAEKKARIDAAEDLYKLLDDLDMLSSEIRLQRKLDEITAIFDASIEAARLEGKSIVELEKQKQKALLNVKKQAKDAEDILRAQKKAGELADNATIAEAAIQSAINIFGNNKALATAQAIISAITGAARAIEIYGPTPMGYAMAAVALSSGYARVRQIQATNLNATGTGGGDATAGAGFDVPQHDRAAEVGGFRWSKDMVRNFSAGALRGMGAGWDRGMMGGAWQGGGASTTTNSYDYADRSSVQVDVHVGTLIGRRGERHLARAVKRAVVRDGARGLR